MWTQREDLQVVPRSFAGPACRRWQLRKKKRTLWDAVHGTSRLDKERTPPLPSFPLFHQTLIIRTSRIPSWVTLKRTSALFLSFNLLLLVYILSLQYRSKLSMLRVFPLHVFPPKFLKRDTRRTVRRHSPVVTRTKRFCGNVFLFSSSSSSELVLRGELHVHACTCIYYIRLPRRIHQWAPVMLGCRNPAPPLLFDAQTHAHHRCIPCRGVAHVLLWSQPLFG